MKKSLAAFTRKTKSIPGNLKVDISAPDDNLSCCLTSNLWEIDPFPDKRSRRPTREIEEFPPKEVYSPYTTYKWVILDLFHISLPLVIVYFGGLDHIPSS